MRNTVARSGNGGSRIWVLWVLLVPGLLYGHPDDAPKGVSLPSAPPPAIAPKIDFAKMRAEFIELEVCMRENDFSVWQFHEKDKPKPAKYFECQSRALDLLGKLRLDGHGFVGVDAQHFYNLQKEHKKEPSRLSHMAPMLLMGILRHCHDTKSRDATKLKRTVLRNPEKFSEIANLSGTIYTKDIETDSQYFPIMYDNAFCRDALNAFTQHPNGSFLPPTMNKTPMYSTMLLPERGMSWLDQKLYEQNLDGFKPFQDLMPAHEAAGGSAKLLDQIEADAKIKLQKFKETGIAAIQARMHGVSDGAKLAHLRDIQKRFLEVIEDVMDPKRRKIFEPYVNTRTGAFTLVPTAATKSMQGQQAIARGVIWEDFGIGFARRQALVDLPGSPEESLQLYLSHGKTDPSKFMIHTAPNHSIRPTLTPIEAIMPALWARGMEYLAWAWEENPLTDVGKSMGREKKAFAPLGVLIALRYGDVNYFSSQIELAQDKARIEAHYQGVADFQREKERRQSWSGGFHPQGSSDWTQPLLHSARLNRENGRDAVAMATDLLKQHSLLSSIDKYPAAFEQFVKLLNISRSVRNGNEWAFRLTYWGKVLGLSAEDLHSFAAKNQKKLWLPRSYDFQRAALVIEAAPDGDPVAYFKDVDAQIEKIDEAIRRSNSQYSAGFLGKNGPRDTRAVIERQLFPEAQEARFGLYRRMLYDSYARTQDPSESESRLRKRFSMIQPLLDDEASERTEFLHAGEQARWVYYAPKPVQMVVERQLPKGVPELEALQKARALPGNTAFTSALLAYFNYTDALHIPPTVARNLIDSWDMTPSQRQDVERYAAARLILEVTREFPKQFEKFEQKRR